MNYQEYNKRMSPAECNITCILVLHSVILAPMTLEFY